MKRRTGFFFTNRKLVRRFRILFWLLALSLIGLSGMERLWTASLQDYAERNYGLWQGAILSASEKEGKRQQENPMLIEAGRQIVEGTVVRMDEDGRETAFGTIGQADEAFWEMAGIRLKTGELPQKPDEIAIEAQGLDALGISYEPGQMLELLVRKDENTVETRVYRLCGVLENYSRVWSTDGSTLNFFTGLSEMREPDFPVHLFYTAHEGYGDIFDNLHPEEGTLYQNENRKLTQNPLSAQNRTFTIGLVLILLLFGVLQSEYLMVWIYRRQHQIRLFRILGIRSFALFKDLVFMLVHALFWPVIAVAAALLLLRPSTWFVLMLIVSCLLLFGLNLLVFAVCISQAGRQMTGDSKKQPFKKDGPKKPHRWQKNHPEGAKAITLQLVVQRLQTALTSKLAVLFAVFLGLQIIFCVGTISLYTLNQSRKALDSGVDYILESAEQTEEKYTLEANADGPAWTYVYSLKETLPESVIQKVSDNGNLELVSRSSSSANAVLSWKNMEDSLVYQSQPGAFTQSNPAALQPDPNGNWRFYPLVYSTDHEDEILEIQNLVSEGTISWPNWKAGKEAVLVLPPVQEEQPGIFNAMWDGQTDPTLAVGTELYLQEMDGSQKTMRLSGIIRTPDSRFRPYTVLTGGNQPERIEARLTGFKNQLPVEMDLSQMAADNGLQFTNYAAERQQQIQRLQIRMLFSLFLAAAALVTGFLILWTTLQDLRQKTAAYQIKFERIGIPARIIAGIFQKLRNRNLGLFLGSSLLLFAGMLAGAIAMTGPRSLQDLMDLSLWLATAYLGFLLLVLAVNWMSRSDKQGGLSRDLKRISGPQAEEPPINQSL